MSQNLWTVLTYLQIQDTNTHTHTHTYTLTHIRKEKEQKTMTVLLMNVRGVASRSRGPQKDCWLAVPAAPSFSETKENKGETEAASEFFSYRKKCLYLARALSLFMPNRKPADRATCKTFYNHPPPSLFSGPSPQHQKLFLFQPSFSLQLLFKILRITYRKLCK